MRYTHAIVVRIPSRVKKEKRRVDLALAGNQLKEVCETLREVCVRSHLGLLMLLFFAKILVSDLVFLFKMMFCFDEYF